MIIPTSANTMATKTGGWKDNYVIYIYICSTIYIYIYICCTNLVWWKGILLS